MQTKPIPLKAPELVNPKARKHSDSPLFKSPLSNALGLGKYSHLAKQHPAPKQIMTPNLQFIKQAKARQSQGNNSAKKRLMKFATQSIQDFEILSQSSCGAKQSTFTCHTHPNKKAKYFLERNTSVGLCTKCALSIGQTEPLLDEQKLHKALEIEKFRQMALQVEQMIQKKREQREESVGDLQKQRRMAIDMVNLEFQGLLKQLKQKKERLITEIEKRYDEVAVGIQEHSQKLVFVEDSIRRYMDDIDTNYSDIVHSLTRDLFDDIMQQYHYKIDDYLLKINESWKNTNRTELLQVDLKPLLLSVESIGFLRKGKDQDKENHNSLNLKNGRGKPRTPHRKNI